MITNKNFIDSILGRTSITLNRALLKEFKENDISITPERWSVLAILHEKDGCSQQTIADATYRDKPATTRLIDNLEKEGLILREADENDRRLKLIFLTEKGSKIKTDADKLVDKIIVKATKNLEKEQLALVKGVLDKIYFNLIDEK